MAEAFAVAASVITLVNTSRKAVEGIAKLAGLRHAPEILLALNNEVVDLQCVLVSYPASSSSYLACHPCVLNRKPGQGKQSMEKYRIVLTTQ